MNTEQTRSEKKYYCSFCDKSHEHVKRLIAGPRNVYICNECITLCNQIIEDETEQVKYTEQQ